MDYVSPEIQALLQVSGNTLQHVEKFKNLVMVSTSDGRRKKELDTQIGKTNAVLRELHRSEVTKRELLNTAKLSGFKSVLVLIFNYGHKSWVITERMASEVQAIEMAILAEEFTSPPPIKEISAR